MTRLKRWAALSAILIILLGCQDEVPTESAPTIRPVRVIRVGAASGTVATEFVGVTKSSKEVVLSFRVGGTVDTLKVKLGDEVSEGDLVANLDDAEASLSVQAAQADLAKARAQKTRYGADYKRAKAMYESQTISTADLDASRAMIDSASADIAAVRKSLQLAQTRQSYHRLRARTDGVITNVLVEENENVAAGEPIALLNAGEGTVAEVGVPARFISLISVGTKAKVTFNALDELTLAGTVSEVGVAATEAATTFPVKIRFDAQDDKVRAGMSVSATLSLADTAPTSLYIPSRAIVAGPKGHRVFVAKPSQDGRAVVERRDVTVGRPTTSGIEVKSGLAPGDLLIIAGMTQIHDGLEVTLLEETVPPGAEARLGEAFPELRALGSAGVQGSGASPAPETSPSAAPAPSVKGD